MGDTLKHPMLLQEWDEPSIPAGYDCIALSEYGFSRDLDFYCEAADAFYSEETGALPRISWPWPASFKPTASDWQAIRIQVVDFRSAFG